MRRDDGQASVELVAMLPLAMLVALVLGQLLAAGQAASLAGHASRAAAMALLQGGDPEQAARAAVPGVPSARLSFRRTSSQITVRVTPRRVVPGLAAALTAESRADAGGSP